MNYRKYDKMYMDIAIRASEESKCPRKHVGCCFLLQSGLISIGLNGLEPGAANEWEDNGPNEEVIHAEEQCLRKLLAEGVSAKGSTVYLTLSPCVPCSKLLVGSKVSRVVYLEEYRCSKGIEYLTKYHVLVEKYNEL